ncbi:hypothetical protein BG005_008990 [Podila minutissima]|nr:hypothetical protein BG005_008990 [Podila minutissima]
MAATGFVWIIAPCVFLLAILLVGTIKYRHKIRATRALLQIIVSKEILHNFLLKISLAGLFVQLIYSWWVSIVVTGFGPKTYEVHPALPFVLMGISYLSFLWTSLVITNIIYATVAGVSAICYLPAKASRRADSIDVLTHVLTTSLGSICYGSSSPFGPVSRILKTPWRTLRSFAFKHTFYNVAVYGMDYDSAAKDLQPRIAGLKIVFTAGAATESALGSVFAAMAHDPEGFARSNPELAKQIDELYGETEEMKTVFDSHSHSLQRTLGSTGTNQAQPPLSTQSSPGESPDITREDEQPPAYQENPVHGLPARPAHQAIDPEDADSVPDKGSKRSWSLHVFVLQMVVFFALTVVAILGYAGTLNLPSTSPEKNFPHYSSSV